MAQNRPHDCPVSSSTMQPHRAVDSAATTARFRSIFQTPPAVSQQSSKVYKKHLSTSNKRIR
ncbi:hypothetical protein BACCOPRO_02707 [Phocaeicola coprophilus DSM 18228 = JCM 13818]|uniref:Uncharacterized protein n=1 Tax=Phocaeicola coprophilus DSM 18228 = JCM 13818 TaxID=547042 RepID=S0FBJ3_9BACT|nr:hypothetical protein BACCOPRO_02707 [Phocaeicola coprophilus DSM 18228 = JCM 13818]